MPYAIYAEIKCLVKKIDRCENNPQIFSTTEIGEYIPCEYLSTIWRFGKIEHKHSFYRGKNYMKEFCQTLKEHAMKIINFEEKKNAVFDTERIKIL